MLFFDRRQQEIVNPVLFEVAGTGDKNLLYQLVENGDDINPTVSVSTWYVLLLTLFTIERDVRMATFYSSWIRTY